MVGRRRVSGSCWGVEGWRHARVEVVVERLGVVEAEGRQQR